MEVGIGLIGHRFMGKAHSNAWMKVNHFFDCDARAVRRVVAGRNEKDLKAFARKWGWERYTTDWKELLQDPEVHIIDVCTPNNVHAEMAIAAAEAGKAVICEKPLAMNLDEARAMVKAVRKNRVLNSVWFNYRRVPALALARRIIEEGRIGKVYHVRAAYMQDWIIAPEFPLVWRLKKEVAGSGAHGDLNAHIIDMARFLVGEISEVCGDAVTFIKKRPLPEEAAAGLKRSSRKSRRTGSVTVDDAVLFLARFRNGAVGTFEATRFANGRKNGNRIEINGEKGSIEFYFERMNELRFFSSEEPQHLQGWKTILVTEPVHPYIEAWWPAGHIIGYEHTFVNQAADVLNAYAGGERSVMPDFQDAAKTQAVLDAVLLSAKERAWVKVPKV